MNADAVTGVLEEFVWHLEQKTCPVTGVFFTATRTTVVEILEDGEGLLDEFVRWVSFDVDDEPDATGIMLECGVI
jgi:repressor of nif and glnA expression